MRVHQIINNYSLFTGGAPRVVRALHDGLINMGEESYILGITRQTDALLSGTQSLGLATPYQLRALSGILRYVRQNTRADDILHVHLFPPLFYLSLLKTLRQIPCRMICTEHSTSNRRRGTLLGRVIDTLTYTGYDRVVAISAGVEQELIKWKPELQAKTCVIYNGVDLHFQTSMAHEPRHTLIILSVGSLRPAKNYANALKAIAMLDDLDFEYHIAGDGDLRDELIQLAHALGIASKVKFLGHVQPIHPLLASADIFLMPSLWEGFGIAAVEAMNASLPIVISDVPGLREIAGAENECAVMCDPNSPASIAGGLRRLIQTPSLRNQLGGRAFLHSKNFSNDKMVDNYMSLYSSLRVERTAA